MGVKSTSTVTREQALAWIRKDLDACSDEQLEDMLETVAEANGDHFINFTINTPYRPGEH